MEKMLIFDMDGTIANLYAVDNWLELLHSENTLPYEIAEPLYNMVELNDLLLRLKNVGYRIVINSWTSKNGSKEYNKRVRKAKIEWLNKHNFPYDEIHIVKYGTNKAYATRNKCDIQILVDDNKDVRQQFKNFRKGENKYLTINAKKDILKDLNKLLKF